MEREEYVQKMTKENGFTTKQAENMYKALKKISKDSNLSIEEAVKLAKGENING